MSQPTTARCLCGAVTMTIASVGKSVGACHCTTCRGWGGGPSLSVDCGTGVAIAGEDRVAVYESSRWAQRGFCSRCGTHLFYRLTQGQRYYIPAGLLDGCDLVFAEQVFIDSKPGYYAFANETECLTGAELFAKHSAKE